MVDNLNKIMKEGLFSLIAAGLFISVHSECSNRVEPVNCLVNPCTFSSSDNLPEAVFFQDPCSDSCQAVWFTLEDGNVTDRCGVYAAAAAPAVSDDDDDDDLIDVDSSDDDDEDAPLNIDGGTQKRDTGNVRKQQRRRNKTEKKIEINANRQANVMEMLIALGLTEEEMEALAKEIIKRKEKRRTLLALNKQENMLENQTGRLRASWMERK